MPRRPLLVQAPPGVTLQVTIKRKAGRAEVAIVQPGTSATVHVDDNETAEIARAPRT